jgi:isocitrate dehydrogenase
MELDCSLKHPNIQGGKMGYEHSKREGQTSDNVRNFEKLASRAREIFEESTDRSRHAFDDALERAKQELVAAGEFSAELGENLRGYIERDFHATRDQLEGVVKRYRPEAERIGVGMLGLMQSVAEALGGLLNDAASSMQQHLTYHTGEICGPGTLTCSSCNKELKMQKAGHVPPCPACAATEFRRSY